MVIRVVPTGVKLTIFFDFSFLAPNKQAHREFSVNLTTSKCFDSVKINYEFGITLHSKSGEVFAVFINATRHNPDLNSVCYDKCILQFIFVINVQ